MAQCDILKLSCADVFQMRYAQANHDITYETKHMECRFVV